jgi:hypothetical protein
MDMNRRDLAKAPPPRPAAKTEVTPRTEEELQPEWRPEVSKMSRSELRRIVIDMIG